jgi:hypothetical protein
MRTLLISIFALSLALPSEAYGDKGRRDYRKAYRNHTEKLLIYDGFATALILRATYLSEAFRSSMAMERTRLLQPSSSNQEAYSLKMIEDHSQYYEFYFSAGSSLEDGQRFGEGDKGWHLRLLVDDEEAPLIALERIRNPNPLHRALFEHINLWSDLWLARFQQTKKQPARIELQVGSGYGNGLISWDSLQHAPK